MSDQDEPEPDLEQPLPDAAHDLLRRILKRHDRRLDALEHGNAPGAGSTDQTGDTIDVVPVTAQTSAQAGAAKGLGIKLDTGWTWRRIAPNGQELARGQTYADQWDAWRGAHRANPGLPWLTTHTPSPSASPQSSAPPPSPSPPGG
jgi:hypothetical protein